jgi:hypothetical protein
MITYDTNGQQSMHTRLHFLSTHVQHSELLPLLRAAEANKQALGR